MPLFRYRITEVRRYTLKVEAWTAERAEEDAAYFALWQGRDGAITRSVEIEDQEPVEVEVVPVEDQAPARDGWVPPGPLPQFLQDVADELQGEPADDGTTSWEWGAPLPDAGVDEAPSPSLSMERVLRWARCKHCGSMCRRDWTGRAEWVHVNRVWKCPAPLTTTAEPVDEEPESPHVAREPLIGTSRPTTASAVGPDPNHDPDPMVGGTVNDKQAKHIDRASESVRAALHLSNEPEWPSDLSERAATLDEILGRLSDFAARTARAVEDLDGDTLRSDDAKAPDEHCSNAAEHLRAVAAALTDALADSRSAHNALAHIGSVS